MKWYKLNPDHTTEMLADGEYPLQKEFTAAIKHVGDETIDNQRVSTVFLHMDHSWEPDGPPVLFETMIFGGEHNEYQRRYCTYDEALQGHNNIVKSITENIDPDFYFNN